MEVDENEIRLLDLNDGGVALKVEEIGPDESPRPQDHDDSIPHRLWIACNADNIPSKKSIERIGTELSRQVTMPDDYPFAESYLPASRVKLRYRWDLLPR